VTPLQACLVRTCSRRPAKIRGGRARGRSPLDFNARQLQAGIRVEREHTTSSRVACEIAMDHLAEDGRYYTKLRRIHRD
jgi:hypothetical protein